MTTHTTGGDIDAWCNKCKLTLAHIVLAMDARRIVRVECKTCKASHAYKTGAEGKKAANAKPTGARAARASSKAGPAEYERVIKGRDLADAQRYRISVQYAEGDVVDHTNFKLGVVTRLLADGKIEVVFPEGLKVLVHARQ